MHLAADLQEVQVRKFLLLLKAADKADFFYYKEEMNTSLKNKE
jgi:hypothetical protein